MPKPAALLGAADVEKKLRQALGHEAVTVKPYGKHFLIQIDHDGEPDTIARITQLDPRTYGAAFKSHTGRWEPLSEEGSRDEMITVVGEELGPYLDPDNY
jgi:hypothetical protein